MMKLFFKVQASALLKATQTVFGAVGRGATNAILNNIHIKVDQAGTMTLFATDLEIAQCAKLTLAEDDYVACETTLPAKKLLDVLRSLPAEEEVSFSFSDSKCLLKSKSAKFTFVSQDPSAYPNLPSIKVASNVSFTESDFKQLIRKTLFAVASEEVRYYLNGISWSFRSVDSDQPYMIWDATDGHRLIRLKTKAFKLEGNKSALEAKSMIIPKKAWLELTKSLSDDDGALTVHADQQQLQFELDDSVLSTQLIDGRYPDLTRVIPVDSNRKVTFDKSALKQALMQASILCDEKIKGITLIFSEAGQVVVQAFNPEREQAEIIVQADHDIKDLKVSLNVQYLLDVLSVLDDEQVHLSLRDENAPILIKEQSESIDLEAVIMPMRI